MSQDKKMLSKLLLFTVLSAMMYSAYAAETSTTQIDLPENQNSLSSPEVDGNLLYQIPSWIDATPTFLPQQSNEPIVPPVIETEDRTWVDRKQVKIKNWADRTSHKIDNWFGETDPDQPASATLRILLDNSWNKHDGYEIKPRIRGRIKLPTLERKVSLVFGDDSLDNELENNVAITNENASNLNNKTLDPQRTRENNSSFALRWSDFSKYIPFETDLDLGLRSGDDVYLRLKASKDWQLENDFKFHAEQIYRYGVDSENYLRTNLELIHARPNQAFLSNQLNLTYADEQDDDLTWDNNLFRQHQFFHENSFSYGLYTSGFLNNKDLRLNSWGPFMSWKQPVWREWLYVQGNLNYFNDHREDRSHFLSTMIRLEALF
ncbi:hypothetical protein [Acinetobacter albensis]|jgi:hypothetical protein|uniref:Selenocysteine synthase n=1 Tax=Acinetobacter albensis TaxID=1673609 RepID=A0A1C4GTR5_9GAMM|nr:hypothetical protein [Acinetobacter albensis]SCC71564.1 hypothetical protein GA0116959_104197 [Acinetobacter albensis]